MRAELRQSNRALLMLDPKRHPGSLRDAFCDEVATARGRAQLFRAKLDFRFPFA